MFLHAVRQYIDGLPQESIGWLARACAIATSARRLRLMHGRPAEDWTLDALAREVGLSRSVSPSASAHVMGTPPCTTSSNWRLQLAARLLEAPSV